MNIVGRKILVLLLVVILVAYLTVSSFLPIKPTANSNKARLGFYVIPVSRWFWQKATLEIVNIDTTGSTHLKIPDQTSVLSPKGKRIAYFNKDGLYVSDVENSKDTIRLQQGQEWGRIWWSPDEAKMAWSSQNGLHVYDFDLETVIVLNLGNTDILSLAWSSTGTKIAVSNQEGLYIYYLEKDHLLKIKPLAEQGHLYDALDWEPDGQRLVVRLIRGEYMKPDGLAVINSDGSNLIQITFNTQDAFPKWSPDGQQIALVRRRRNLYLIKPDGTFVRRVTSGEHIRDPFVWEPNGSRIAYISEDQSTCRTIKSIIPMDFAYEYCPPTIKVVDTIDLDTIVLKDPKNAWVTDLIWLSPE